MGRTQIRTTELEDGGVRRNDLNITVAGQAVIRKVVQGTGVTIGSTGADSGTGDVTINIGQAVGTGNSPTFAGLTINGTITSSGAVINGSTLTVKSTDANVGTILFGTNEVAKIISHSNGLKIQTWNGAGYVDHVAFSGTGSLTTFLGAVKGPNVTYNLYSSVSIAGGSAGNTAAAIQWIEISTSYVTKISLFYRHRTGNKYIRLTCLSSWSANIADGATIRLTVGSTTATVTQVNGWTDETKTVVVDVSGFTNETTYLVSVAVKLDNQAMDEDVVISRAIIDVESVQ